MNGQRRSGIWTDWNIYRLYTKENNKKIKIYHIKKSMKQKGKKQERKGGETKL